MAGAFQCYQQIPTICSKSEYLSQLSDRPSIQAHKEVSTPNGRDRPIPDNIDNRFAGIEIYA